MKKKLGDVRKEVQKFKETIKQKDEMIETL